MKTNRSVWTLAALALACLWGVATAKSELPMESLDSTLQLACVHDDHSLILMRGDGSDRTELVKTEGNIISPSWSPDGRKIAFYAVGGHGVPILSEYTIRLCSYDIAASKIDTLTEVDAEIKRGARDKYVAQQPPVWIDNNRLTFLDTKGIHLTDLGTSTTETIVASDDIGDYDVWPPSGGILYLQGKRLLLYDPANGESRDLFAAGETVLPKKEFDCLAASPAGTIIALGDWNKLYLIDTERREIAREAKLPGAASDLLWSADGRMVFCLTGTGTKQIGDQSSVNPTGSSAGAFQVSSFSADDEKPSVLYKKLRFDVTWTQLDPSPDGRWLLFISNDLNETKHYLYVLSTEGKGIRKLAQDGGYAYPVWRP